MVAIIIWWSTTENLDRDNQLQQASGKRYVEIFMDEFELTTMNENGTPDFILNGSHLEKFNDSEETEIQQPVFHLLQQGSQWKITADSAILNNTSDTIQLNNNVLMQQQNNEPVATIRTQSLLIHTKTQIAQTNAAVEITRGKARMKSKGMFFNNLSNELSLSSDVNGYFLSYE